MKVRFATAMLLIIILLTSCDRSKGVYGKVTDNDTGKPISEASVELKCTNCDARFTANTDPDGNYSFPDATAGKYLLTIILNDPPSCPGIAPFQSLGTSGEFIVAYTGYGGLGGTGNKRIIATVEFELEQSKKFDLKIACPQ